MFKNRYFVCTRADRTDDTKCRGSAKIEKSTIVEGKKKHNHPKCDKLKFDKKFERELFKAVTSDGTNFSLKKVYDKIKVK